MARHISEYLTPVGRVLVVATILISAAAIVAYAAWGSENLPPGSYPLFVFAAPILFAAAIIFFAVTAILRAFGIKVFAVIEDEKEN